MPLKISGLESLSKTEPSVVNSMGGTELQMKWLRENVDNELLDKFQIIPSRVRGLENKPRILWMHDTADDPEVQHLQDKESLERFKKIVYVSHWQKQQFEDYLGIPSSKGVVIQNAINPIEEHNKPKDKINIIYHTTPHRGLHVLLPAFDRLCQHFDNIHLDIYSSFKIYGWDNRDIDYKHAFDFADRHPHITNHGTVSNAKIREALKKAHIFAYPSIWPETSCIALIEAMSAGCLTVCSDLAALPETASNFATMYSYTEDIRQHANLFASVLHDAIDNLDTNYTQNNLEFQKLYFDRYYSWELRKHQWTGLLTGLEQQWTNQYHEPPQKS